MPTVLRNGPYRFFFYAGDREEPPHIHVERDDGEAKFWLEPVRLQWSYRFTAKEVNQIKTIVIEHHKFLLDAWNEYFSG